MIVQYNSRDKEFGYNVKPGGNVASHSEETKQKKSESAKAAWDERIDYSRKCEAPGCDVHGKAKYKIIEGVRYCNKHGLRMLRNGNLESKRSDTYTCFD